MKVQEVMTSNVKSCRPESNLAAAASLMWERDFGVLPVVNDGEQVIGMLTDRDIAIAVATHGQPAHNIRVGEVISGQVYSSKLNEDLQSALGTMRQQRVRRLPVVSDDGKLQGILSLNDIVQHAEEAKGKHPAGISYADVVIAYKAICEPRPQAAAAA